MSTMEDKELQEMFAAKRTVEANRHRQEELRKLMATSTAPKSRRLWPVWVGAAAACLALLLITLPMLFQSETAAPMMVAETDIPTVAEPEEHPLPEETIPPKKTLKTPKTIKPLESTVLATMEIAETIEEPVVIITEPKPIKTEVSEEPIDNSPRIHRRTSTSMVCSNCSITNVPTENTALQNFLVATFGAEVHPPLILTNIEF